MYGPQWTRIVHISNEIAICGAGYIIVFLITAIFWRFSQYILFCLASLQIAITLSFKRVFSQNIDAQKHG